MSGAYRGEARTDARDAYVIAETARYRRDFAAIEVSARLTADLALLTAHRSDLVADHVRMSFSGRDTLQGCQPSCGARSFVVSYHATLNVSSDLGSWLENLIAARRSDAAGNWRVLTSWDQAVILLVLLARGDTFPRLGAHVGVSTDTAWRYVNEGIEAPAPRTPTPVDAHRPLLDGTLIPTRRYAAVTTAANPDPLHSGKHRRHGMNIQPSPTPPASRSSPAEHDRVPPTT